MNAIEIEEAVTRLASEPFNGEEFPFAFLMAFGNKDTTIKKLRSGASNKSDVGGVLQINNAHIKVAAKGHVNNCLKELKQSPATTKAKARFIVATDGVDFETEDLENGETRACSYEDFPNQFGFFLPLAGISTVAQIRESSFDIRATSRLNRLYVELLKDNPDWGTAERSHAMNHFMARLIFCFFAESTDIFSRKKLFIETVEQMSERDSSNTHEVISEIFSAMDTDIAQRETAKLPRWADAFPYVNGGLFEGDTDAPRFSKISRSYLLHIGGLDWTKINPDIFGSMIQAVADDEERGELGMHYTSVPNILKVLNPLFLDDLREKLAEAGDNPRMLLNLRKRISRIRLFDPACGSGNFLVIAYKQLRDIENTINVLRGEVGRASEIPLTNFRGIELRDFSAEIARLALVIAEYQCDLLYRGQKEALAVFLPLDTQNWITCGNALRIDWVSVCPSTGTGVKLMGDDLFNTTLDQAQIDFENEGGETYICGNPPYLGGKKKSDDQKLDMELLNIQQQLDYVCAFIIKAVEYLKLTKGRAAIVATSSICQGEQVSVLWPEILKTVRISFAYRPFKWQNSAANNAGVFCTIIGLDNALGNSCRLFDGNIEKICSSISPYLISGNSVICYPGKYSISGLNQMVMGSNPVDGRRLIFDKTVAESITSKYPESKGLIRDYYGTQEFLHNLPRKCLWIEDSELDFAKSIPPIAEHIEECRIYRLGAGRDAKKSASKPHRFCYTTFEDKNHIVIGKVFGEKYKFVPADYLPAGSVVSVDALSIYSDNFMEFSIISSTLHRVWAEAVAGRIGNGIRYGNTVVYNTFPLPTLTDKNKQNLVDAARNILLSRESYFPATISQIYDPERTTEFSNVYEAHEINDELIERIYIGRRFRNDTERLEKLFELYTKMTLKKQILKNIVDVEK
jgi:hypothetical protein